MKSCIISFRSVTPAQRGEGVLRRAGIECSVQRTPRWMEEQGCGYSLTIRCQDVQAGLSLLQNNGIPFRKAYLRRDNDTVEEIEQ